MALIKCPECGKEVSDKACSCPNCGYPILQNPISQSKTEDTESEKKLIFCPKCLSTHVHAEQKGFSGGKALAGVVAIGGIGILAGTIGSKKVNITCLKCGYKFMAGNAFIATKTEKEKILNILESKLSNGDKIGSIKFLNERFKWKSSQSMEFIEAYLKGHKELKYGANKPKSKKDIIWASIIASIIILNIALLVLNLIWGFIYEDYEWEESKTKFWVLYLVISALIISVIVKIAKSDINKIQEKQNKDVDNSI